MYRAAILFVGLATSSFAQQRLLPPGQTGAISYPAIKPIAQPTITPGQIILMELEGRFQKEVASGGGKAFSSWFAEDAVALNNGKPAMLGRGAIAASAQWTPAEYQLNWTPQGAEMGPSNDMGFTWGHYESRYRNRDGQILIFVRPLLHCVEEIARPNMEGGAGCQCR